MKTLIPIRSTKINDKKLATKAKKSAIAPVTIKSGDGLLGRINEIKANVEQKLGKYRDKYIVIRDTNSLINYFNESSKQGIIAIDTETDGLDPITNHIAGLCIYTPGQKGAYVPINHLSLITQQRLPDQLCEEEVNKYLSEFLNDSKVDIDMFNASFDIRVCRNQLKTKNIYCTWDGYLGMRLLNENELDNHLKDLHKKYVLNGKEDAFTFESLFKGIPFTMIPIDTGYLYAARDPEITYELCEYERQYLRPDHEREDMRNVYWVFKNIEMPCVPVVADMEDAGVLFDFAYNSQLQEKYHKILNEREDNFHKVCDKYSDKIDVYRKKMGDNCKLDNPISIDSPTQLAILLYDVLGYKGVIDKKTKKMSRSTDEEALKHLNNELSKAILAYRELSTIVGTFIDALPNSVNPKDGRIHCHFNQYGARTGRFSSSDPNLQNIPSHNKDIRKMFKATDGYVLMSSDYSQQEPKVMTQMCQDPLMIEAYKQGKDLYAQIASMSFNKPYEECLEFRPDGTTNAEGKERRSQAKSILLGVLYGRGTNSIAEQLGVSTKKAQQIKDSVFKGFPAIPKFAEDSLQMARDLGYVTTLWGRKRRLPDLSLPEYEFKWENGVKPDNDLLDFDMEDEEQSNEVPEDLVNYYWDKLDAAWFKDKPKIKQEAKENGILIIDNGGKIAEASRQVVNSRIQGSAADMTKLAMILINNNARLKELGFRLLIQVHDELIAECPKENAKECKKLFSDLMSKAAESRLTIPIKCDVEVTECWYGKEVSV